MEDKLTVKQIRGLLQLTQKEYADKLNVKLATYVNKENGKTEWSAPEFIRISATSGIPLERIDVPFLK